MKSINIVYSVIFAVIGIWMLAQGLRVIIRKKPLIYAGKIMLWLTALSFSPTVLTAVKGMWDAYQFSIKHNEPLEWMDWLMFGVPLVMYPLLFLYNRKILRGYSVIGVTDESFRQAIYAVLKDLGMPFEERLSKLHLTNLGADLEVNVSGAMGTANVRVKQPEHQPTLEKIAAELRRYFAGSHVEINTTTGVYYALFGAFILAIGVFLTFFLGRH